MISKRYQILEDDLDHDFGEVFVSTALDREDGERVTYATPVHPGFSAEQFCACTRQAPSHPRLARVLDCGDRSDPFAVFELLPADPWPEGWQARVAVVASAAEILASLHHEGKIYGTVSPGSIRSRSREVRLAFPGLALFSALDGRTGGCRGRAAIPGPIDLCRYYGPEWWRGHELTPAHDVYGLGVTLFELISGRRPSPGRTISDLYLQICVTGPPALDRRDLPPRLADLIRAALAIDPLQRPPAGELAAELRHVAE